MKQINLRKFNTFISIVIGVAIVAFVFLKIVFPEFRYKLDVPDKHGAILQIDHVGKKNLLHVSPLFDYEYNSVCLKLKFENTTGIKSKKISIFKGFVFQSFPVNRKIDSSEEFQKYLWQDNKNTMPNGSLISCNETVFVIENGKARAFIAPEVFEKLGFKWNSVIKVKSDIFGRFDEGDPMTFGSLHPDGTLLKFDDKLFLVKEKSRIELVGIERDEFGDVVPLEFFSDKLKKAGECNIEVTSSKQSSCEIKFEDISEIGGNDYIFDIPQEIASEISDVEVVFKTLGGMNIDVAKTSLARIKNNLALRYFPELIQ